jgi:hypothetical protein
VSDFGGAFAEAFDAQAAAAFRHLYALGVLRGSMRACAVLAAGLSPHQAVAIRTPGRPRYSVGRWQPCWRPCAIYGCRGGHRQGDRGVLSTRSLATIVSSSRIDSMNFWT